VSWDPGQYLQFAAPRLRPAIDLLQRIDDSAPALVYDLGCGAGNVTRALRARWPEARLVGVDASPEMLALAQKALPGTEFVQADLARWRPDKMPDVIYSNAALQWLDDHRALFRQLFAQVAPGGVLAVQMPRNFEAPSHTLIAETALSGPWRRKVEHLVTPPPVKGPAFYHDLLAPQSQNLDIWETEYLQVLQGENPVKEWTKGTWLMRYLDALDGDEKVAFEKAYGERVAKAYPPNAAGETLFPFRRLFMIAQRKG